MALTKTVNYIQTKPVSLGFSSELSSLTGTVRVTIDFDAKAGRLNTGVYGASESYLGGTGYGAGNSSKWEIEGTQTDVNAALDSLVWTPRAFEAGNTAQDITTIDRTLGNFQGERIWLLADSELPHSYTVGDSIGDFRVTKVFADGERISVIFKDEYYFVDNNFVNKDYQAVPTINVIDDAVVHPFGDYTLEITVLEDGQLVGSVENLTLVGQPFVAEPEFSVAPVATFTGDGLNEWSDLINLGTTTQANNELIYAQLLVKRHQNDTSFDGNVALDQPSYVTDESYAVFSQVKVDRRTSESFPTGPVRWQFYGTPEQVSRALAQVRLYEIIGNDFFIETRLITNSGRTRIYNSRGYD